MFCFSLPVFVMDSCFVARLLYLRISTIKSLQFVKNVWFFIFESTNLNSEASGCQVGPTTCPRCQYLKRKRLARLLFFSPPVLVSASGSSTDAQLNSAGRDCVSGLCFHICKRPWGRFQLLHKRKFPIEPPCWSGLKSQSARWPSVLPYTPVLFLLLKVKPSAVNTIYCRGNLFRSTSIFGTFVLIITVQDKRTAVSL